jgi:hypothetical protein
MNQKALLMAISALTFIGSAAAQTHSGPGILANGEGGWMHNGMHMTGYNMWGLGWIGLIPGLLIWIFMILAIIYLYQKITEE